ncbi:zinc finger c3hc4 type (ring finger) [Holotrichia oblita]|uniref:Zinc finger c3hc4 type (Ring finger) n=1 Tax=Holotrichia oblita TaxID=644536 RepID=A0ACB9ST38_HOLOL|nr:zinc finger c3hc4 type (ring finger) [Holotrichia oblita]
MESNKSNHNAEKDNSHSIEDSESNPDNQDCDISKLEESEPELATCQEEECVICIHAKATMQTAPCGHQVVCRKCFVKTIQIAVSQRLLPLRCVICRAKILRLKTGPLIPQSVSGYSVNSRTSSVPQSDSLYSVSSGGSSISSTSCSSDGNGISCCGGHCLGAYPRQPTGALRKSQQHAMKIKLQEYNRGDKPMVNRLPPIKELPVSSPSHNIPPASTRIRCAQKIVTQLETVPLLGKHSKGYKYEKLPQNEEEEDNDTTFVNGKKDGKKWWSEKGWRDKNKSEERDDNKKNEITEKEMELKEKQKLIVMKQEKESIDSKNVIGEDARKKRMGNTISIQNIKEHKF